MSETEFRRYAIYFAPDQGPFADFGARWLGWDAASGEAREPPKVTGLPRPAEELTRTPRRYGLHGTIKPPFRLAAGHDAQELEGAARRLCADLSPVELEGLRLSKIGGFLALVPDGESPDLARLAAACVEGLDPFRAAPGEAELARRRKAGLSDRQEAMLARWGYPYVMDEFRFHITLTGRLDRTEAERVEAALEPDLLPMLPRPYRIEALHLAGEDAEGWFHLIRRLPLGTGAD